MSNEDEQAEVDVSDPDAYEHACLEQVRGRLAYIRAAAAHFGRELGEVRLVGAYPTTELVIDWKEADDPREARSPLWVEELQGPNGRQLHPEVVAVLLTVDFEEPE